jgi:hypothetical protein
MYNSSASMIIPLIIAALLGLIPANIAKKKGYSFGLWWLFGFLAFIIALIVALVIKDKTKEAPAALTASTAPPPGMVKCPHCNEYIKPGLATCPYCAEKL